ncbi:MAG: metallophosphoesterase family protein [Anaerolineae bacterium]|nr:metallophosphoesterase family protein [Anaerolineae bacterium]
MNEGLNLMGQAAICLALVSDVHGNLPALEAVLVDAQAQGARQIVVAGDSTGGSHSRQVVERLRDLGAIVIRGNNEDYVLDYDRGKAPADWYTSSRWAPMRFVHDQFDAAGIEYLASLPHQGVVVMDGVDGIVPIRVLHGSPRSTRQHLLPDGEEQVTGHFQDAGIDLASCMPLHEAMSSIDEPILVCGHSHIQWTWQLDGRQAINPGSVGGPINCDWRAQYALLTWQENRWQVDLRGVEYDRTESWTAAHESGFLEMGGAFARACLLNIEQGRNVPGHLVAHSIRLAATAGHTWDDMPEEVWERAVDTFDWALYPAGHEGVRGYLKEGR